MHCVSSLIVRKASLSLTSKYALERRYVINSNTNLLIRPQFRRFSQNVRPKTKHITLRRDDTFVLRLLRKIGIHKEKYQLIALGYLAYEDIIDKLNYSTFYKDFNMPDTFFSWYLVTELHVWMLMVRFMAEGENGKVIRNNLVEAMWKDVDARIDDLGIIHPKIKKKQLIELVDQFNAALIQYDQGILSDDKVLASALWRRFFCSECNNPEFIEKLLIYVRKQTEVLDKIPPEEIYHRAMITWIELTNPR